MYKEQRRARTGLRKKRLSNRKLNKLEPIFLSQSVVVPSVISYHGVTMTGQVYQGKTNGTLRIGQNLARKAPSRKASPFRLIDLGKPFQLLKWYTPNVYRRNSCVIKCGPLRNQLLVTYQPMAYTEQEFSPGVGAINYTDEGYALPQLAPFKALQDHYLDFNAKLLDQKVDLLTTLGETKSTLEMLGNAATDLFQLYRHVKRGNIRGVKKVLSRRGLNRAIKHTWKNKPVQNRWLELQYGWSPLCGDISTAFKHFASDRDAYPQVYKCVKSTIAGKSGWDPREPNWRNSKGDYMAVIKTACYYSVEDPKLRDRAKWNVGLNPLLTAWELVPYSFVVDWFLPIGDFLAQAGSSAGLRFISGTTAYYGKWDLEKESYMRFAVPYGYVTADFTITSKGFVTDRVVHGSSPIGIPTFDAGVSVGRALNALALLTQRSK